MNITVAVRVDSKGREKMHATTCRHRGEVARELTVDHSDLLHAPMKEVADCAHTEAWDLENRRIADARRAAGQL